MMRIVTSHITRSKGPTAARSPTTVKLLLTFHAVKILRTVPPRSANSPNQY